MHEVIISDTSCLIVLNNINELHLLKSLYNNIIITPELQTNLALPYLTGSALNQ